MGEYIYCSKCGAKNQKIEDRDYIFCQKCGFKIVYQKDDEPGKVPVEPVYIPPINAGAQSAQYTNSVSTAKPAIQSWSAEPPRRRANGFGIAGLVLAVIGTILLFVSPIGGILIIISLICSIGGLCTSFSKKAPKDIVVPIIGIVIGGIGLLFALTYSVGKNEVTNVPVEDRDSFIASCEYVDYQELSRNPGAYKGKHIYITVQIAQVLEKDSGYRAYEDYDINFENPDASYYSKEWCLLYKPRAGEGKILNDDILTCYGTFTGTTQVVRALTNIREEVPTLNVQFYDLQ